jgi:hypothetical protein
MLAETLEDVDVPINGDSLAFTTLHPVKLEFVPTQNETVVAVP